MISGIYLEDGNFFEGQHFGPVFERAGEVVFNTAHSGYEEIATDPSYFGQIVVMSAPMQGNYGVRDEFWESRRYWIEGFVCLEMQNSTRDDLWSSRLSDLSVPFLTDVDTRKLVLHLRDNGTLMGAIVTGNDMNELALKARQLIEEKMQLNKCWPGFVVNHQIEYFRGDMPDGPKIALVDFGYKKNILRELLKRSSEVGVFPFNSQPEVLFNWQPKGVLLSNGPGDPSDVTEGVGLVDKILGKLPIFGICMGHQILGLALGGKTYPLKFGHRGVNHPVKDINLDKVYVTSQNHGYALGNEFKTKGVKVTHINLNDNTVSGIEHREKKCFSVQFHPESHPGPRDGNYLFDQFIEWVSWN